VDLERELRRMIVLHRRERAAARSRALSAHARAARVVTLRSRATRAAGSAAPAR